MTLVSSPVAVIPPWSDALAPSQRCSPPGYRKTAGLARVAAAATAVLPAVSRKPGKISKALKKTVQKKSKNDDT